MSVIPINIIRGERIFNNIQEYPLPLKDGVKDYLINLTSPSDGYGIAGEAFFDLFYPNHVVHRVANLEDMIDFLFDEIQSKNINQIRELVILAHGNRTTLALPLINNLGGKNKKFKYFSAGSIKNLQVAFWEGAPEFNDFKNKRNEVIKKFLDDSWITIRCCRFGYAFDAMHGLYSFFGGRANVYAPMEYQYFSSHERIGQDKKFTSRFDFFDHLQLQGLIPRNENYSFTRTQKVLNELITPGKAGEPFILSNYTLQGNNVTEGNKVEYDSLINSFNDHVLPDNVRKKFQLKDLSLSEDIEIRVHRNHWLIFDGITLEVELEGEVFEEHIYNVLYRIEDEYHNFINDENYTRILKVYYKLIDNATLPSVPYQFFANEHQDEKLRGKLFELGSYFIDLEEGELEDVNEFERYQRFVELLDGLPSLEIEGEEPISLLDEFQNEGYPLTNPIIRRIQENPPVWKITHDKNENNNISEFFVEEKVENFLSSATRLIVRVSLTEKQIDSLLTYYSTDCNTPGTELLAYLDRHSKEELLDFIYYLRSSYKKGNAFYLRKAQEALMRKLDFFHFFQETGEFEKTKYDLHHPWVSLTPLEVKHSTENAYPPHNVWKEVKSSTKHDKDFETDLFMEKELPFGEVIQIELKAGPEDSRFIDQNSPRDKPIPTFKFLEKEDLNFVELSDEGMLREINCETFQQFIDVLVENQDKTREELMEILKTVYIEDNSTIYDYWSSNYYFATFEFAFQIIDMTVSFGRATGVGSSITVTVSRATGIMFGLGLAFNFVGGFLMFKDLATAIQDGQERYEKVGVVTGVRESARIINAIGFDMLTKGESFPDDFNMRVLAYEPENAHDYHLKIKIRTPFPSWISYFIYGYAAGLDLGQKIVLEELKNYKAIFSKLLAKKGLGHCQSKILIDSGLVDDNKMKAVVLLALGKAMMDQATYSSIDILAIPE
ncbi:hypothetical protein U6A24_02485 [Aquimarina gracilis]|uniref:Uncharacterized protein n=1 Tax=Aquimarina gracilis TaxID=874422 RepID=A0ABU5ZQH7_9FLAO|nr:hypothetical protein [Aquimarina gracilis]MEB3344307.1 hypothetical protein [Aquimarina gracilis]